MPRHGILIREREEFRVNQFATFECEVGYQLIGDAVLKCVPDLESGPLGTGGKWDSESPTCQGRLILKIKWTLERKLKQLITVNLKILSVIWKLDLPLLIKLTHIYSFQPLFATIQENRKTVPRMAVCITILTTLPSPASQDMSYMVWRKYNVSLTEHGAELFLLVHVRLSIAHIWS